MTYRQSIEGALSTKIGGAGLAEGPLAQWLSLLTPRFKALQEAAQAKSFAHFRILSEKDDIEEAAAAYTKLSEGAETVVILGTGGSSLGGQALAQLGGWSIPGGEQPPHLRFYDNLDARSFMQGLRSLDIPKTRFIAISKSGTTGETLLQVLTAFKYIEDAGHANLIPKLFLGVTEPEKPGVANGLRGLFAARGIPMLAHSTEIGGRYSAFTNVGFCRRSRAASTLPPSARRARRGAAAYGRNRAGGASRRRGRGRCRRARQGFGRHELGHHALFGPA